MTQAPNHQVSGACYLRARSGRSSVGRTTEFSIRVAVAKHRGFVGVIGLRVCKLLAFSGLEDVNPWNSFGKKSH